MYASLLLVSALLSAIPCHATPLPETGPSPSAVYNKRAGEVVGPPWPWVGIEPTPGKKPWLYVCPSFNKDCKGKYDAKLVPEADRSGWNLADNMYEQTGRALCKYVNANGEWFYKLWDGWYLTAADVHPIGMPADVDLNEYKELPHCAVGDVAVSYYDEDYDTDEDRATPGGCIKRKVHWNHPFFIGSAALHEFSLVTKRVLNSKRPLFPAIKCLGFLSEKCEGLPIASASRQGYSANHLFYLPEGEEQDNFAKIASFQCF